MNHDNLLKNDSQRKFVSLLCKFKNNYPMEKLVGMKKSEFVMLMTVDSNIEKKGRATVSAISKEMRMTSAAASKTIGVLEDNGLIEKKVNKDDKRQAYIEITEKGKKQLDSIKIEMGDFTDAVFSRFGKENADKLLELFEQIYSITTDEVQKRIQKIESEEGK